MLALENLLGGVLTYLKKLALLLFCLIALTDPSVFYLDSKLLDSYELNYNWLTFFINYLPPFYNCILNIFFKKFFLIFKNLINKYKKIFIYLNKVFIIFY